MERWTLYISAEWPNCDVQSLGASMFGASKVWSEEHCTRAHTVCVRQDDGTAVCQRSCRDQGGGLRIIKAHSDGDTVCTVVGAVCVARWQQLVSGMEDGVIRRSCP